MQLKCRRQRKILLKNTRGFLFRGCVGHRKDTENSQMSSGRQKSTFEGRRTLHADHLWLTHLARLRSFAYRQRGNSPQGRRLPAPDLAERQQRCPVATADGQLCTREAAGCGICDEGSAPPFSKGHKTVQCPFT